MVTGDTDTLIEQFDADIGLFDNALVVGRIVGDGKVQVITSTDGVSPTFEVQRIQHSATARHLHAHVRRPDDRADRLQRAAPRR